jgi:hypothetical protein
MKIAISIFVLALAGCVTTTEVVPIGNDQFMLTGHASGGLNAGKGTAAALQKASEYCAARAQQQLVLMNTDAHGMAAVGGESTNVIFSCAAAP